jgi:hypothetical protein
MAIGYRLAFYSSRDKTASPLFADRYLRRVAPSSFVADIVAGEKSHGPEKK